jgi:hypothetical protein
MVEKEYGRQRRPRKIVQLRESARRRAVPKGATPTAKPRPSPDTPALIELQKILQRQSGLYRAQFVNRIGVAFNECDLASVDAESAILEVANLDWPPGALGLRIVDNEGLGVFERLKADR